MDWGKFKNVLCIRPDNLGDVLMTSPAIRAFKESVPNRKVTLLTSSAGGQIARFIPQIDDVIVYDIPWYKHGEAGSGKEISDIVKKIKERKFDAAIIFTVFSQNPLPTAMLCYMAGIQRVAGYCRENPYNLMSDWIPDHEPVYKVTHEVERQLELVRHLGASVKNDNIVLSTPPAVRKDVLDKMHNEGIDMNAPWLVLHPGVSEAKRQYPVDYFAEVARQVVHELGYQVVITGVESEGSLASQIMDYSGEGAHTLVGKLDMAELIALISEAPLLISNNTGPVHIAAGVGTPVVVLYAMTNPQHTPWRVPNKVLTFQVAESLKSRNVIISQANEKYFDENKPMVQPEEVLSAAKELLDEVSLEENFISSSFALLKI